MLPRDVKKADKAALRPPATVTNAAQRSNVSCYFWCSIDRRSAVSGGRERVDLLTRVICKCRSKSAVICRESVLGLVASFPS